MARATFRNPSRAAALLGLAWLVFGVGSRSAEAYGCHFRERPVLALAYQIPGIDGQRADDAWDATDLKIVLDVPMPCPADSSGRVAGVSSSSAAGPNRFVPSDPEGSRLTRLDSVRPHPVLRPTSIERPPRLATT